MPTIVQRQCEWCRKLYTYEYEMGDDPPLFYQRCCSPRCDRLHSLAHSRDLATELGRVLFDVVYPFLHEDYIHASTIEEVTKEIDKARKLWEKSLEYLGSPIASEENQQLSPENGKNYK